LVAAPQYNKFTPIGIIAFFQEREDILEEFLETLLPFIQSLALNLEKEFPTDFSFPLLTDSTNGTVTLTKSQCATLNACGFLNLFEAKDRELGYHFSSWPDPNHITFLRTPGPQQNAKYEMLLNYFRRLNAEGIPDRKIIFHRRGLSEEQIDAFVSKELIKDSSLLSNMIVKSTGTIEDDSKGAIEIDFANKFIGGGVLETGCVQEEIRFMLSPECLVSMLFMEAMNPYESIAIIGTERYSNYTGYAFGLKYGGNYEDKSHQEGGHPTPIVAIDALCRAANFEEKQMKREVIKAYAGFSIKEVGLDKCTAVSTGNWGCGAFGGNIPLKAMLQWIAASKAGRDVLYFTFNDHRATGLEETVNALREKGVTVGQLWKELLHYSQDEYCNIYTGNVRKPMFAHLRNVFCGTNTETSSTPMTIESNTNIFSSSSSTSSLVSTSIEPEATNPNTLSSSSSETSIASTSITSEISSSTTSSPSDASTDSSGLMIQTD